MIQDWPLRIPPRHQYMGGLAWGGGVCAYVCVCLCTQWLHNWDSSSRERGVAAFWLLISLLTRAFLWVAQDLIQRNNPQRHTTSTTRPQSIGYNYALTPYQKHGLGWQNAEFMSLHNVKVCPTPSVSVSKKNFLPFHKYFSGGKMAVSLIWVVYVI